MTTRGCDCRYVAATTEVSNAGSLVDCPNVAAQTRTKSAQATPRERMAQRPPLVLSRVTRATTPNAGWSKYVGLKGITRRDSAIVNTVPGSAPRAAGGLDVW